MENQKLTQRPQAATLTENALIHVVEPQDISQGPDGSSYKFPAANLFVAGQDNIDIKKTFKINLEDTNSQILEKINTLPQYYVNEKQSVWFIAKARTGLFSQKVLKFKMLNKGKGTYGSGATELTMNNIELMYSGDGTLSDIETDPATDVVNYGNLEGETASVSDWVNTSPSEVVIQPQDDGYTLFQGTINAIPVSYLWIGEPGVYGDGEQQATEADFQTLDDTIPQDENNVPYTFNVGYIETMPVAQGLRERLNELTFHLTPIDTPVLFTCYTLGETGAGTSHTFLFMGGKGAWGAGGNNILPGMLYPLIEKPIATGEIEDADTTIIVPLGEIGEGGFLAAANAEEHDFSDTDVEYYFSYYIGELLYLALFIGAPGMYGGGLDSDDFVNADFAQVTNGNISGVPTLQQVNAEGSGTTAPLTVKNQEGLPKLSQRDDRHIFTDVYSNTQESVFDNAGHNSVFKHPTNKPGEHTYAMTSDIGTDLPENFFISCKWKLYPDYGNEMCYITDTLRILNISAMIGIDIYTTRDVLILDKSTLAVIGELFDGTTGNAAEGNYFILIMTGCKIIENELIIASYSWSELPDINRNPTTNTPYTLHGSVYHRGFIYLTTRVTAGVTDNTQILRVNPWDLSDVKYFELPTSTGYDCAVGDIQAYEDNLYLLGVKTETSYYASLIRVDENLTEYEILFQCGNISSAKRVMNSTPFLIYNDAIYIPYRCNNSLDLINRYDTIGFYIYDFYKKTLIIDTGYITISSGATAPPVPHWITIFNGKILLHTAGATGANCKLVRLDLVTMDFEEAITIPQITSENSLSREGYIYLNPEQTHSEHLLKIKYNNFLDYNEISPLDYYALGSFNWNVPPKKSLKTKLSDFEDDLEIVKTISINGNIPQIPDGDGNIDLNVTAGDYVAVSPDTTETFDSIAAVTVMPGFPDSETIYLLKETGLLSGETEVSFSVSTLILIPTVTRMFVTFTGTTATITLPAIISSEKLTVTLFNRGSGNLTINSNAGGNDIDVSGSVTNTVTIASNANYILHNNGNKFIKV